MSGSDAPVIVVKLLRTDTTLDLSHKARVVKKSERARGGSIYTGEAGMRTDHASRLFVCGVWIAGVAEGETLAGRCRRDVMVDWLAVSQ